MRSVIDVRIVVVGVWARERRRQVTLAGPELPVYFVYITDNGVFELSYGWEELLYFLPRAAQFPSA